MQDTSNAMSSAKPPYSYTALITRVILASPKRRLTLAQIYDAIKTAYPYYQTSTSSWQNSVRHNLSISKNFMRIPRKSSAAEDDSDADEDSSSNSGRGSNNSSSSNRNNSSSSSSSSNNSSAAIGGDGESAAEAKAHTDINSTGNTNSTDNADNADNADSSDSGSDADDDAPLRLSGHGKRRRSQRSARHGTVAPNSSSSGKKARIAAITVKKGSYWAIAPNKTDTDSIDKLTNRRSCVHSGARRCQQPSHEPTTVTAVAPATATPATATPTTAQLATVKSATVKSESHAVAESALRYNLLPSPLPVPVPVPASNANEPPQTLSLHGQPPLLPRDIPFALSSSASLLAQCTGVAPLHVSPLTVPTTPIAEGIFQLGTLPPLAMPRRSQSLIGPASFGSSSPVRFGLKHSSVCAPALSKPLLSPASATAAATVAVGTLMPFQQRSAAGIPLVDITDLMACNTGVPLPMLQPACGQSLMPSSAQMQQQQQQQQQHQQQQQSRRLKGTRRLDRVQPAHSSAAMHGSLLAPFLQPHAGPSLCIPPAVSTPSLLGLSSLLSGSTHASLLGFDPLTGAADLTAAPWDKPQHI